MAHYEVRNLNCNVSIPRKVGKTTIVTHGTLRVNIIGISVLHVPFMLPISKHLPLFMFLIMTNYVIKFVRSIICEK